MIIDSIIKEKQIAKTSDNSNTKKSRMKSAVKSISWRMVGTIDTMVISYFITGELKMAVSIGSIEVFSKMVLFYFHERAWEKVK